VLQAYIAHPGHDDPIKFILQHIMDEHYTAQPATSKHAATPKMQFFTSVKQTSKSFSEGTWYFITNIAFRANQLDDPMIARHGNKNLPCIYKRGSTHINYILTTWSITSYISSAGILSCNQIAPSGHKALFIDVNLSRYLKGDPHVELSHQSKKYCN
jgi:hypothetical protein